MEKKQPENLIAERSRQSSKSHRQGTERIQRRQAGIIVKMKQNRIQLGRMTNAFRIEMKTEL